MSGCNAIVYSVGTCTAGSCANLASNPNHVRGSSSPPICVPSVGGYSICGCTGLLEPPQTDLEIWSLASSGGNCSPMIVDSNVGSAKVGRMTSNNRLH
ncbi:hypothetical protein J1N35_006221 [Gossypium stocksii]|uniref:Uncharacterized protein n=1 Tax=Gossypium stocksii TaxID=47602 RepID=A0A9D3WGE8_9ROSI|nr:hypothetical protein J1N35_006221 [Gossypium stocksii]